MDPATWSWAEKTGIVGLLCANILALVNVSRFAFKSLQERQWVPGWAYDDLIRERDRLRAENDAYRDVTLRAIRVTSKLVGHDEED